MYFTVNLILFQSSQLIMIINWNYGLFQGSDTNSLSRQAGESNSYRF